MTKPSTSGLWIAAAVVAVGFVFGLWRLLSMRFEQGDLYPPCSSLRTDPLGAKALYESLDELPGVAARRNYRPLKELGDGTGRTLLLVGLTAWSACEPNELLAFAESGGRVVLALQSGDRGDLPADVESAIGLHCRGAKRSFFLEWKTEQQEEPDETPDHSPAGESRALAATATSAEASGRPLPWYSPCHFEPFDEPDAEWTVRYRVEDRPVILERKVGAGSLVAMADSYLLTNEALLYNRRAELLAWLVGSSGEIVFDETHLGVAEQTNIAALGRRYRLGGLLFVLIGLGLLGVWKSATSFLPKDEGRIAELSGQTVRGAASSAGLVHLLRKAVRPPELVGTCVAEWGKSLPKGRKDAKNARGRAEAAAAARGAKDPVAAYREIQNIVTERTLPGKAGGQPAR